MTYVPIIPHVPVGSGGSSGGPAGKPPWLKLEDGEVFVRAYGAGAGRPKRPIAAVLIGLVVLFGMGLYNFYMAAKPDVVEAVGKASDSTPWIAIAVGVILILNVGILIAIKATRSAKAEAYLTSKMLIVKSGKDYAGVRLADITAIKREGGSQSGKLVVHARSADGPVAHLPVEDTAAALVELTAYSKAEGAKLA